MCVHLFYIFCYSPQKADTIGALDSEYKLTMLNLQTRCLVYHPNLMEEITSSPKAVNATT